MSFRSAGTAGGDQSLGDRPDHDLSDQPARRTWAIPKLRTVSFRTRLGTLVAVAVGLTVALASMASYFVVRHQLLSSTDSSLQTDIAGAKAFSPDGTINPDAIGRILRSFSGAFVQVIDSRGNVIYSSQQAPQGSAMRPTSREAAVTGQTSGTLIDTNTRYGSPYRVITEPVQSPTVNESLALQIARPVADIFHTLSVLRLILWLVSLGGVALGVLLGYFIGRDTLKPVARLTAAAEHVAGTQDLSATIEVDSRDELGRLAHSFNAMLTALASSRQQQGQLISDAGHELRTPLTSLRTNIEVLLRVRDLPETDRAELTHDVEAQLEELTNLIGDLVDLARHEERDTEPMEVRLDTVVERALERARRRAGSVEFDVHLTPGSVRAQPALLERAVLNVLDNATKWSPPAGRVQVWLQRGNVWSLEVRDQGPGISAEDLPHVFDRFYRAASARAMPGSGLGLAIVNQVVGDHGGTVAAFAPPGGGTLVRIELPIVAEMEDVPARP